MVLISPLWLTARFSLLTSVLNSPLILNKFIDKNYV